MIYWFKEVWPEDDDFECAICRTTRGRIKAISEIVNTEYGLEGDADYCYKCAIQKFGLTEIQTLTPSPKKAQGMKLRLNSIPELDNKKNEMAKRFEIS